jgi:hypothetical protein
MQVGEHWYLIDTGTSSSFSRHGEVTIDDTTFVLPDTEVRGLDGDALSELVGVHTDGLLGNDVLSHFDHVWDLPRGQVTIGGPGTLSASGDRIHLSTGTLISVAVDVQAKTIPMLFDTGAQISYYDGPGRDEFAHAGEFTDFYPGRGQFVTPLKSVPVRIGDTHFTIKAGSLKPLWGVKGPFGIIGNEILKDRVVGFFPQRKQMVLGATLDT